MNIIVLTLPKQICIADGAISKTVIWCIYKSGSVEMLFIKTAYSKFELFISEGAPFCFFRGP
jgi:hypothetical protein